MAIPPTAERFLAKMDPQEELDFRINVYSLTEGSEEIATGAWTLEVLAEGVALGLTIMTGDGRDAFLTPDNRGVIFWLAVDALSQGDESFDGGGIDLPLRVTFETDAVPSRTRQRTFLVHLEHL